MRIPVDLTTKDLGAFVGVHSFLCNGAEISIGETGESEAVVLTLLCSDPEYQGKTIQHRLNLPLEGDTASESYLKRKFLKIACDHFKIPMSAEGFDFEQFVGKSTKAVLKHKQGFDNIVRWL